MARRFLGDVTLCSSKRCCRAVSRSCLRDSTASSAGPWLLQWLSPFLLSDGEEKPSPRSKSRTKTRAVDKSSVGKDFSS